MEMIKLKPAYKDYLWGGTKLKDIYGMKTDLDIVAEAWELSAHPDGPATVENGSYAGKLFTEYLQGMGKAVWGKNAQHFEQFPILIKFIDAKQALSIQVHPDDEYALRVEHEYGKNEMWYIVDCEPGSFLYYGVNQNLTKEEFRAHIENDTILDVLNKVEVKKGDCFFIKSGTIHAIGAGCLICEIQQNSNSTYRVYDFDRVGVDGKPRELHIQKAVDVSQLTPSAKNGEPEGKKESFDGYSDTLLAASEYFTTNEYEVEKEVALRADETSFQSIIILHGEGKVVSEKQTLDFKMGDSIFVPAGFGDFKVIGKCSFIKTNL
ncbi:mannose-6-phosphate isomerase [Breznakia sp. PF5-3]|uniref:type I phosphomannose isomerase catalytic subunit n=1 Tax=unclassified Breznakia TaxID=2623764 RepID=UPI0024053573|nr:MULTISPECIES: type I phosphomannose isomerase catalytic subunit [unclassified Breznakia]MDF9824304.1 mannose-6-phosphate isomerase [Breznakia sp. PM6-1]MDF9835528.1 mannose-6-phosphate isomerase [Breznakia sp. PF5-3]MDF9838795.1 mannose-6-phosphate isomerase [Breznakia sp. PFB2-8]MDF9860817.1 mannose-6-phosphate isomerase [Breznakia sp. PH5-24]